MYMKRNNKDKCKYQWNGKEIQNTSKTKTGFEKINKIGIFLGRLVKEKKTIKILKITRNKKCTLLQYLWH